MKLSAQYFPAGDSALVVEYGDSISVEINMHVRRMARAIERAKVTGIVEIVPTYRSLAVLFDPLVTGRDDLLKRLRGLEGSCEKLGLPPARRVEIPVRYGGKEGPDLGFVAKHNGLSEDDVIRLHTSADYTVFMIGFTPGFPYLGGMPQKIAAPRLETPRLKVPAGSVGIAGPQTGVYPVESPGGWRIIGRTDAALFNPSKNPPALLEPGDVVRFVRA